MIEYLRFGLAALLMLLGVGAILSSLAGVFRFDFVLNRMQSAAVTDTLGILCVLLSLMVISGELAVCLKLLLILVLLWFSSPISSHLVSKLEVRTDPTLKEHLKEVLVEKSSGHADHLYGIQRDHVHHLGDAASARSCHHRGRRGRGRVEHFDVCHAQASARYQKEGRG